MKVLGPCEAVYALYLLCICICSVFVYALYLLCICICFVFALYRPVVILLAGGLPLRSTSKSAYFSPTPDFPNSIFTFVTLCKWYSVRQYLAALSILPISSKAFPYYFCQVAGARYFHLHHKMKERGRRGGVGTRSLIQFSVSLKVDVCVSGSLLWIVRWLKADERRKGSKWGLERAGLVPQEWHSLNKFYNKKWSREGTKN